LQSLNHYYDIIPIAGIANGVAVVGNVILKRASFANSACWMYQMACSGTWRHLYSTVQYSTLQGRWSQ